MKNRSKTRPKKAIKSSKKQKHEEDLQIQNEDEAHHRLTLPLVKQRQFAARVLSDDEFEEIKFEKDIKEGFNTNNDKNELLEAFREAGKKLHPEGFHEAHSRDSDDSARLGQNTPQNNILMHKNIDKIVEQDSGCIRSTSPEHLIVDTPERSNGRPQSEGLADTIDPSGKYVESKADNATDSTSLIENLIYGFKSDLDARLSQILHTLIEYKQFEQDLESKLQQELKQAELQNRNLTSKTERLFKIINQLKGQNQD